MQQNKWKTTANETATARAVPIDPGVARGVAECEASVTTIKTRTLVHLYRRSCQSQP